LATVLSTPWRLCLTATVYHHDGDPGELLTLPDADALDRHLLARFIPAAVRTAPNPRGYTPQDVHRWLHHLTTHLDPTGTFPATAPQGAEATDLVLHELWPLAGRTRVQATDVFLTTLTFLFLLPFAWTAPQRLSGAFMIGIGAAVSGVVATQAGSPMSPANPFRTPQRRREFALRLTVGLVTGLTVGLVTGLTAGPTAGLTAGLAVGLAAGLAAGIGSRLAPGFAGGLAQEPGANLGARAVVRSDALVGLVFGLLWGLAVGLAAEHGSGPAFGLTFGLTAGLTFGLISGGRSAWRYAVFLLCSRRRLPFRLGLFLDWAVTTGLMRHSGPAYQYRHRELQHWLRQYPQPSSTP